MKTQPALRRLVSISVFVGAFAISHSAWAPPGGNGGGGGGNKGSAGGGESDLRLCATFAIQPDEANYVNPDGAAPNPYTYCDGTDGEILVGEGLKLSTTTRNPAERTVYVDFHGSSCAADLRLADPSAGIPAFDSVGFDGNMDAFFGWQKSLYTAGEGCTPDPANPATLACLEDTGTPLAFQEMSADQTEYMSWRVNLTDPSESFKKNGNALLLAFGGSFAGRECSAGLPIAITCTAVDVEGGTCVAWDVETFSACAYDYDTRKGGNWRWGGDACPVNANISFTAK